MIKKIKYTLKNNDGGVGVLIKASVFFLVILMIFIMLMQLISIMYMINNVKINAEITLDKLTNITAIDISNSVKNGNDYSNIIKKDYFTDNFRKQLNLTADDMALGSETLELKFMVTDTDFTYIIDSELKTTIIYTLAIPISFMGYTIMISDVKLKADSVYTIMPEYVP